jgi:NTE family protein
MPKMPWEKYISSSLTDSLSFFMMDSMTKLFSPYQLNPFDVNPLRDVLAESVDFDELRQSKGVKLFISATHVHSGKVRVFEKDELSLDVVMASACLPFMYKAVSVEVGMVATWATPHCSRFFIKRIVKTC